MNMLWGVLIPILLLSVVPQLTQSQRVRLETADDGSTTVDEAAFYALLENVSQWPEELSGVEVYLPGYAALRSNPERQRGRICLIEGRLQSVLPPMNLSHPQWQRVRGVVIRVDGGEGEATAQDLIIVYLTNPPDLESVWYNEDVLKKFNAPVRVFARFYKIKDDWTRKGRRRESYLAFVGKQLMWMEWVAKGARAEKGGDEGEVVWVWALPAAIVALIAFWVLLRIVLRRRGSVSLHDRLEQARRTAGTGPTSPPAPHDESEQPPHATPEHSPLPEDPAEALRQLERQEQ